MLFVAIRFPSGGKTYTYQVEGLQGARPTSILKPQGVAYGRPYGQTLSAVSYWEATELPTYVTKCLVVHHDGAQWVLHHEEWAKPVAPALVAPKPVVRPVAQAPKPPKLIRWWLDAVTWKKYKNIF